jgi:pantoate--beta-alanine ligase
MLVYRTFSELSQFLASQVEKGNTIGFVPTMGALHDGHLSLIKDCNSKSDISVCSIFVNPTQFNNPTDLEKYPRTEVQDLKKLETVNCDVAFLPDVLEVYPKVMVSGLSYKVDLEGLDEVMEGAHRPGHFDGVVEVISRFFSQIRPNLAFFGEKDFQQLAIIKHMVRRLNFQIEIVSCPILRNENGFALSSRNVRLSTEGLKIALLLNQQLHWAKEHVDSLSISEIIIVVKKTFNEYSNIELEYFEVVESKTLKSIQTKKKEIRAFIAAHVEGVRLIDNMALV